MTPYDMIREPISKTVPFSSHTGIELISIENGIGEALLPAQDVTLNHIGSQHAGALFTLGEAASMRDEADVEVATMQVDWHVSKVAA